MFYGRFNQGEDDQPSEGKSISISIHLISDLEIFLAAYSDPCNFRMSSGTSVEDLSYTSSHLIFMIN